MKQLTNPMENKEIGCIFWPFYRYKILLPKEIHCDALQWLYISLIKYYNRINNLPEDNYSDNIKSLVVAWIKNNIWGIYNKQTLETVVSEVENNFVERNKFKDNLPKSLDIYDNLFSDNIEIRHIFQDGVTGSVLPYFYTNEELAGSEDIKDVTNEENGDWINPHEKLNEPQSYMIKSAYNKYIRTKKYSDPDNIEPDENDYDEYYKMIETDDDTQILLEEDDEFKDKKEKTDMITIKNMKIQFVYDSSNKKTRSLYHLPVKVKIQNNEIKLISPFKNGTDSWMTTCFTKAKNIDIEKIDPLYKKYSKYIVEGTPKEEFKETTIISSLKYCSKIYQLIDGFNIKDYNDMVIQMDRYYSERSYLFFHFCGNLMDLIMRNINYKTKSTEEQRKEMSYSLYCGLLDNKFTNSKNKNIDYRPLKYKKVFDHWKDIRTYRNGKTSENFKADLTDVLWKTNLVNEIELDKNSITDIFEIYGLRNKEGHWDESIKSVRVDENYLVKAGNVIKTLVQIKMRLDNVET